MVSLKENREDMKTTLSIIIPAWNEEFTIPKTCYYLQKLKLPFEYSELIFIAGGEDRTFEICRNVTLDNFSKVITLRQNPGDFKSGALIKGINNSKGDIISLIDSDVFISPNLAIEVEKSLEKFDVVCCDYIPMVGKGFWYNYYTLFKLIWISNPNNLNSLIGGATISLRKEVVNDVGVSNFFSDKSSAGVDYYMGLVLKKNKKMIGFVKNTRVLMPRPNNIKDFLNDQRRWLNAFFSIHQKDLKLLISNFVLNVVYFLSPFLLFLLALRKLRRISTTKISTIKSTFSIYLVDFLINFMSIINYIKLLTKRLKILGHFKSEDRYLP